LKLGKTWLNHRLQYCINNNEELKKAIKENRVMFGCLDTWLLARLKMDKNTDQLTDVTSISSTGIYDLSNSGYSTAMLKFFKINSSILPKVVPNSHNFGFTHEKLFGVSLKIAAVITDQSASMIANCCFKPWSSKITLGTSSLLQVNIGNKFYSSSFGPHTLAAWSFKNAQNKTSTTFKLEMFLPSSIDSIKFIKTAGLCSDESEMSGIATAVGDTDGVFFLPEIYGFIGIKQTTNNQHLLRAILESIVFTIGHFYYSMRNETNYRPSKIRIDGGISQNDFICQGISDLTGVVIERSQDCSELTSIGCAILSAFNCGVLKNLEDAESFYRSEKAFTPDTIAWESMMKKYQKYEKIRKQHEKLFLS
jgi:glycerol kinase